MYEKPLKAQVITGGLKFHHMIIRISNSLRNFILTIANFGTLLTYMQNRSRWTTLRASNTLNNSSVHQYHHQWFLQPCQIMMQIQITLNCFKYVIRATKVHSTKIQVFDSKTYFVDKNYKKLLNLKKRSNFFSKVQKAKRRRWCK